MWQMAMTTTATAIVLDQSRHSIDTAVSTTSLVAFLLSLRMFNVKIKKVQFPSPISAGTKHSAGRSRRLCNTCVHLVAN